MTPLQKWRTFLKREAARGPDSRRTLTFFGPGGVATTDQPLTQADIVVLKRMSLWPEKARSAFRPITKEFIEAFHRPIGKPDRMARTKERP